MSWSITLSGPQNIVERKLSDLILVADQALTWIQNAEEESNLNLTLNGYVTEDNNNIVSSNVGFQFSETVPLLPEQKTYSSGSDADQEGYVR